jgi:hypothetical protein
MKRTGCNGALAEALRPTKFLPKTEKLQKCMTM